MGINAEIRGFHHGLVDYINKSGLPIELKRLVIADVARQIDRAAEEIIKKELEAQEVAPVQQEETNDHTAGEC